MPFKDDLAAARFAAQLSQADAARALTKGGVTIAERTLAGYEMGEREPSVHKQRALLDGLRRLAKAPPGDGDGPVSGGTADPPALSLAETLTIPEGYVRIAEAVIEPAAGDGTVLEVEVEEVPGDTLLPAWFIRAEYGVSPERVKMIRVRGDSMHPTIKAGQRLLVALLVDGTAVRDGLIYVFIGPGGVQIKRLYLEDDAVHVWSDNADAPRFRVPLSRFYDDYRLVAVALETNHKL